MTPEELLRLIDQAAAEGWTELDLSGKDLTELPPEIGKLTQLQTLILGRMEKWEWVENQLTPTLVTNQLTTLPLQLTALQNLTTLNLSGNPLSVIPECVFQLQSLESLIGVSIGLLEIPAGIGSLSNLTTLSFHSNQISHIPEEIGSLSNLTTLDLSSNQISHTPEEIGSLSNLTMLDLSSNQISEIPEIIGTLTNLTVLYLHSNQISQIPAGIGSLSNLTTLDLAHNQISEISAGIGTLTNLTGLYLYRNQISEIPAVIGSLTNLTVLRLHNNQISEIPAGIDNLTNLTELYLHSNQISEIPAGISNLTNLTVLSLHSNQISEIPAGISTLTNLTVLSFHSNQISQIPAVIGDLTNLTELYLYRNQISEIPAVIGSLSNLTQLSLWDNQISQIPEVIGSLTNLTTLYLSSNQISQIPEVMGSLANLTLLDLSSNQISKIPNSIAQITNLETLDLRGNPINIPPDILAPTTDESLPDARPILNYYFRTQDPDKTTHLYEAKILIVGEGGSGKTSLARKLLDPDYELLPETTDISTQGIDILRWKFIGRNHQTYQVNIWDFGGQEIYHQTHQFFLTDRSLYLLVADSRKENTDHYFWLQIIRLLSDNSPVLLVQNEKQNRTCTLNLPELRAEFENLKPALKLNLAGNRGLPEVQTTIQNNLEELLPNGIPFPNSWLNVRYALENDGRNFITDTEYEATCRQHGITQRTEMYDLSGFLHSLGICLHFHKDPILRRYLILKPNWGTAAVYKILDNPTVKANLGQFTDADLADIWQACNYADMHHELLQLMKQFKVCYEIPHRNGNYIAPHLLLPDQPEYDWDTSQNLTLRYRYKSFMPKGILTRFIVEMHERIENVSEPGKALVWKNGVVLKRDRARAEILERYHDREIRIRLTGINQRDFLVIINDAFQKIHDSYERLAYDTLIPCNCDTCKANPQPHSYTLDRLRKFIELHRPTIQCPDGYVDVNVRRLLDDTIDPPLMPPFSTSPFPSGVPPLSSGVPPLAPGLPEMYPPSFPEQRDRLNVHNHFYISNKAEANAMTDQSSKTTNFNAPVSTGAIGDGNTVSNNQFTQVNNASTAELLQLIASLRQTAAQFPKELQDDIIIDIDDIETEVKKPEAERNPGRLKKRLLALAAAGSMIATPIVGMTDFATKVVDLGEKVGIEIQLPQIPPAP